MSGEGPAARRYLVRGRVQGVGFRYFALESARDVGLVGFARNLPDGRVEVLAQGEPAALAQLEERLLRGPALARVDELHTEDASPEPHRSGFDIRT